MSHHAFKDITYHNDIAQNYDGTVVAPRVLTNDVVYKKLGRFVRGGTAMVDLGCGTGHLSTRLGRRFLKVTAVDHSSGMLAQAKQNIQLSKLTAVQFIECDALAFLEQCRSSSFDFVGSVGFLHHLQPEVMKQVLNHITRVLKSKGQAIFQEPIKIPPDSLPEAIRRWNAQSVVTRMQYCHNAPPPDEEPLAKGFFDDLLGEARLKTIFAMRNWEIFPHSLPPTLRDKVMTRILNALHGNKGNVYSLVTEKS